MSDVTLNEVIDLVADGFSIPRHAFRAKGPFHHLSWEQLAKHCATTLARKHTQASWKAIATALCTAVGGRDGKASKAACERFERDVERYEVLRRIVDSIEDRIDEIHEKRVAARPTPAKVIRFGGRARVTYERRVV